ncbi:MAG: polynucleotide adenylyltransferase [Halomonas sp.]|uniref:Polynucleotide adenylyltransferase n=1 Tax=Halomonas citrativorans TaxID=2742612 RepID=A0ABR9FC39_9GAMM|nr:MULTISPECIES: polynucleotide adenylyltransferase [Halomonas]MBE0403624.1 polynucleotide adenylyltransferase [Halomonas citrativorans]HCR96227.1 polynucleotide adenylyltransferase [Halomonas sp.]
MAHSNDPCIAGLDVYRVGGAVRDALLGWPVYDNDWVVVGATPAAMRQRGFKPVGRDFPVFLHPDTAEEYALARTERKTGHGYSGFEVHASPEVTLEEDLLRRDLTVNAIAQRVDGPLIDPFDGQKDIEQRVLRHISSAFGEDPLRVLRTARFLARYASLGFSIASETLALMTEVSRSGELEHLAAERVWVETEKALGEPSPEAYFTTLAQCEALAIWWPFSAEKLQSGLAALQYVPDDSSTPLAHWRYALLVSVLDDAGREALASTLRLPNAVALLARYVALTLSLLKEPLEAIAVLHWLERLDGFRKPDQVATQLTLVGVIESAGVIEKEYAQPLQVAWQAARSVSPQGLIAQGFKGAELGQALREQRQQAVSDALSE